MVLKTRIVLASKSPRREALLRGLELPCELEVVPADIDESCYQMSVPRAQAAVLSVVKAQAVAQQYPLSIVIGADTVVELDGVMMGKPKDEAQAREMLTALSDKTHTVHTGIALCCRGEVFSDVVSSRVTFRALEPEEIDRYIASGEPFDKAGGYGIQGRAATMVRAIDGDYFAVMGLPLCRLSELLRQHFGIWLL